MKRVLLILLLVMLLCGPGDGSKVDTFGMDQLEFYQMVLNIDERYNHIVPSAPSTEKETLYTTEILYLGTAKLWLGAPSEGTISGPIYEFVGNIEITLPGDIPQTIRFEDPIYIVAPSNLHRMYKNSGKWYMKANLGDEGPGMSCDDCYIAQPSVEQDGVWTFDVYHVTNLYFVWSKIVLTTEEVLWGRGGGGGGGTQSTMDTFGYMYYGGEGYFTGVALQSDSQPEPEQTIIVPTFSGSGYSAPFGMSVVFADISTSMELDGVHYDCVNCRWSPPVPARYGMSQNCCH